MSSRTYAEVMARRGAIMQRALGLDYAQFEREGGVAFDYEGLVASPAYSLDDVRRIQAAFKVGDTPLWELPRLSALVRQTAPPGQGARILLKDEAGNAAGSFKARRASLAVAHAADLHYEGVVAATSGNYGAAVASQAAMRGLKAIILQEVFDSKWRGQPEILEKTRVCEAYGAEVWQVTVGPELFYWHLITLEETGFFNASLYTPYGILGIETLGYEIAQQCRTRFGRDPDAILVTHSGGGNVTGTARGLRRAGAHPDIIGVSVDLTGLHMASDHDFNRKSFTTGHTGFGFPFTVNPDRVDVPRNAARGLRYLDRYITITQGEVFFATQLLAELEGLERGPAGNTSLAAALSIARELPQDALVVVQESEYTGAGKHPTAQLTMARELGIEVRTGDPRKNQPGKRIVIPVDIDQVQAVDIDLNVLRRSYLGRIADRRPDRPLSEEETRFLAEDTGLGLDELATLWDEAARRPRARARA
ncbi:MAG: 2-amino-4-oxopentanoate thiolase subunit OrtB [Candidatus Dormibacteraeota bacterium]|nr:2-amino-4-oxopentanoate thiolase subunit OrtB [Candidatus Dormibacteraeota bacterium]